MHSTTYHCQPNGSFTDPSWADTHSASWRIGAGAEQPGRVAEENQAPDATGTVTGKYAFPIPGQYEVQLIVNDDDGGVDTSTTTINVLTALQAFQVLKDYITGLPSGWWKERQLMHRLNKIEKGLNAGKNRDAIRQLLNLRNKADGCLKGKTNGDWITNCGAQRAVGIMVDDLIRYLR